MLPAPLFFELDTLINRVTLRKNEYKTRQTEKKKKERKTKAYRNWHGITYSSASSNNRIISLHRLSGAQNTCSRYHNIAETEVSGGGKDVCHVPLKGDGFARDDLEE